MGTVIIIIGRDSKNIPRIKRMSCMEMMINKGDEKREENISINFVVEPVNAKISKKVTAAVLVKGDGSIYIYFQLHYRKK